MNLFIEKKGNVLILIVSLISFFSFQSSSQSLNSIGIYSGCVFSSSSNYPGPTSTFAGGVFYEHLFSKRAGLQTGFDYLPLTLKDAHHDSPFEPWFCNYPDKTIERFQLIECPLIFKWNLIWNENLKHDFYIMPGFSFAYITDTSFLAFKDRKREKAPLSGLTGLVKTVYFAILGVEYVRPISNHLSLSIDSIFRVTNIYDERYSYIYSNEVSIRIKYRFLN